MRRFRFKIVFLVGLLVAMGVAGGWLLGSPDGTLLREQIAGETPRAKIAAYVQAILRGDEQAALDLWEPAHLANQEQAQALSERRRLVTRELCAARASLKPGFVILRTEWWGTCCEPTVASDSRDAGGARVQVQFVDDRDRPVVYVFDVFVRDLPYWGAATGYAYRRWVIRDIYRAEDEPYFWRLVYEPRVRYLEWKPATP
jgi:hypothetical protein